MSEQTIREMAEEVLALDKTATRGPWHTRTRGGLYLFGVADFALAKLEKVVHGTPFEHDVALIARYRGLAPVLARTVLEQAAIIEALGESQARLAAEIRALREGGAK